MSFNGSGSFLINTAGQPVVSGTVISSTAFNALTADLATGLSTCITKDGQTTVTANIPMANYKFTGLGAGSAAGDSANLSQVQSTVVKLLASVSGTDTITAVGSPTVAAYAAGQMFYFVAAGDNTGAVTINIDSLGAKAVTRDGSVALAAGDIKSGEVVVIVYDGTRFQVVSQLNSSGDARFANVSIASSLYVGGVATIVGNAGFSANVSIASALSVGGVATITGTVTGSKFVPTGNVVTGNGMYLPTTNTLAFSTDGTERLRIDSSGNAGLGVTPSAWNTLTALQVKNSSWYGFGNECGIYSNAYYTSGNWKYIASAAATGYDSNASAGAHRWFTAASGTAGNNITFTQAMTLTADGRLGIGETSPSGFLHVNAGSIDEVARFVGTGSPYLSVYDGATREFYIEAGAQINFWVQTNKDLRIGTNSAERARITSGGEWLVGKTSYSATTGTGFGFNPTSQQLSQVVNTTVNTFAIYNSTAAAYRFFVSDAGTVNATNATISAISDQRLKENVRDLDVGLDAVLALKPRKFDWKEGKGKDIKDDRGFIAQELEQVFPDLVDEWADPAPEGEEPYKSVRQDLIPVLVKAIQELKAELDATKAKVAALEGA